MELFTAFNFYLLTSFTPPPVRNLLYQRHKAGKPNLPEYLQMRFQVRFLHQDHLLQDHRYNYILCKCTFS